MPPPCTDDWEAVKNTAIARNSIKEAADLHNVPYEAARQRASREEWPVGHRTAKAVQNAKQVNREQIAKVSPTAVTAVTSTADALVKALADDSSATKIGFSKAARKVAEKLPDRADLMDKDTAQAAKHWYGVAAGIHGYETAKQGDAGMVHVTLVRLELPRTEQDEPKTIQAVGV